MTGSEPPQIVTFGQMKEAIGSLVFLWSRIERELTACIERLPRDDLPSDVHGIRRSIDLWSSHVIKAGPLEEPLSQLCQLLVNLLKDALSIRNMVCHGLVGITAQVSPNDPKAHLTVELGREKRNISWDELDQMFAWMSRAPWLIRDLTSAAFADDPAGARQNLLLAWSDFPDGQ